jgi:type IV secretory pathway VirB2 component (pilin)
MKRTLGIFLLSLSNAALAAGDPFAKTTTKLNELGGYLAGPIAIAVFTITVIVAGYLLLANKCTKETAIRIIGAGILISGASAIGGWALQ